MTPEKIRTGEKIDKPGLYAVDIEWYHSDCCDGPSISSTGIRQVLNCPAKYWAYSPLNPSRLERERNDAFDFGKAAHALLVEGDLPDEIAVSPYPEFRTNEAKAWRDRQIAEGRAVIKAADLETIRAMADTLRKHPIVEAGGLDGLIETSLIWRDEKTGVWLKARPDVIPLDGMIIDYKTTTDASLWGISKAVASYRYDIQLALVAEGMARVLKRQVSNAGLLCQEKAPPHIVGFYELSDAYMAAGLQMVREGASTFERCLKANDWPGYDDDNATLICPDFITKRAFGKPQTDVGLIDDLATEEMA